MKELYDLKEKLIDELKTYGKKEMSAGSLDVIDKLAHATKNLCKVIEDYEESEGYSSRGRRASYGRGRNAKRDSMGRYSSEGSYEDEKYYYNERNPYHDDMMRDDHYDKRR